MAPEKARVILPALMVAGGVVLLYLGADWLVKGAATLGARLGISPIVVGLTVVSMGTSAPELVVCVLAALQGTPDIATGNVLGSNLANVGLILGLAALLRPLEIARPVVRRDVPCMIGVTLLVLPLMMGGVLGAGEGLVLGAAFVGYIYLLVRTGGRPPPLPGLGDEMDAGARAQGFRDVALPAAGILGGSLLLVGGGQGVVGGATALATALGIPELLIGLSVVAVGTSLPELATAVLAAVRKESDLAVGNIVGSNIFNLTLVFGGTALVAPITLPGSALVTEYPAVLVLSVALLPLVIVRPRLGRAEGAFLLLLYAGAWAWIQGGAGAWLQDVAAGWMRGVTWAWVQGSIG